MKNSKAVFQEVVDNIHLSENPEEIRTIVWILLDHLLGISKNDIMSGKIVSVTPETSLALQKSVERINRGEPVQYVLGEAYFYGRNFQVNPSVLIPRPETEELIRAVLSWKYSRKPTKKMFQPRILDIGTGTGCIPITLFLEWTGAEVFASDISSAALSVAVKNAEIHGAKINFIEHDILTEKIPVSNLDVIVSNPPYVAEVEKHGMSPTVLDHEPHLALFVPDADPLIFYKEIVKKAVPVLNLGGLLAMEINEKFGDEVFELFIDNGFTNVSIARDVSEKLRVVKGQR